MFVELDRLGLNYPEIHRALTARFCANGCGVYSEYLADVTLDRVATKIEQGTLIQHFLAFTFGVASLVFLEYLRDKERFRRAAEEMNFRVSRLDEFINDIRRECQERCVDQLDTSDRQLLIDYYIGAVDRGILATDRRLSISHLRTRIHRLKARLKSCVEDCLQIG